MSTPQRQTLVTRRDGAGGMKRKLAVALLACAGVLGVAKAHADGPMTWTLEPLDFDGYAGYGSNLTQSQLGGTLCPCTKIPYVSDAMPRNIQKGADNINKLVTNGTVKAGDTVMGFSLGMQVVSLYLSEYTPPAGVKFVLVGDTLRRNQQFVDTGNRALGTGGVPWATQNEVTMVANEFDGYSDQPDVTSAPGYLLAQQNANAGEQRVHNYANARLDNPGNVVAKRGNITAILIPTQKLPVNDWMRDWGNNAGADARDAQQRAEIEAAYSGARPTAAQLSAAADEQVGVPPAAIVQTAEPAANVG